MRRLLKQPLTWMVVGEIVVVAALVGVSWHLVAGAGSGAARLILPEPAPSPADTPVPLDPADLAPPADSPPAGRLQPGLNLSAGFWRARLIALNAAEQQVEGLEWMIVHSAMDTVHRYLESVVIPAVEHAEKRGT